MMLEIFYPKHAQRLEAWDISSPGTPSAQRYENCDPQSTAVFEIFIPKHAHALKFYPEHGQRA